ncbi:MAG: neutral zinc metallopeptidase [Gemmatimonadales bacterium]|nr:neutral zinc metallopeptidase [Gemmatimonadales bacterium]
MRWKPGNTSRDIEDRRGMSPRRLGGGRGLGIGGVVILLILSVVFKQDFFSLLGAGGGLGGAPAVEAPAGPVQTTPEEELRVKFVSFVLDSTQSYWERAFPDLGAQYVRAKLVLFRDAVESACGFAQAATGPFYCPGDQKVYIDLSFFDELDARFGAPGDFAQAYVLAHEIGHHVQTLLGVEGKVRRLQQSDPDGANRVQVRMELQADCLAGVWGHEAGAAGLLQEGDIEEGLGAAAAVGDDRIQKAAGARVNPEGFTHGSSEQRMEWFRRGYRSGRVENCDTFGAR